MSNPVHSLVDSSAGARMFTRAAELYPICRSITGEGTRQTLRLLQQEIPLTIHEVKSGTQVLDWEIPDEWVLTSATLHDPQGRLISDVARHSLELVNYSSGYQGKISRAELDSHLHSLPNQPNLIPYKTSYYARTWGFCLPHAIRETLPDGNYQVDIHAQHIAGSLSYGELLIPGELPDEILLTTHICHPSLANDNCSGMTLLTELAIRLIESPMQRYSYRCLFIPGTIGAITWLALNAEHARSHVAHGLVIANVGDAGGFHYKRTRRGDAVIDRAIEQLNQEQPGRVTVRDFSPYGYDERQFCSPGFNLPVGSLTRTPHGQFPEYHTSADSLDFLSAEALSGSFELYLEVFELLNTNRHWRNLYPNGEPMLGRRGLYRQSGGHSGTNAEKQQQELALLWVLNLADGSMDLLALARRSGLPIHILQKAVGRLREAGLLTERSAVTGGRFE